MFLASSGQRDFVNSPYVDTPWDPTVFNPQGDRIVPADILTGS